MGHRFPQFHSWKSLSVRVNLIGMSQKVTMLELFTDLLLDSVTTRDWHWIFLGACHALQESVTLAMHTKAYRFPCHCTNKLSRVVVFAWLLLKQMKYTQMFKKKWGKLSLSAISALTQTNHISQKVPYNIEISNYKKKCINFKMHTSIV